MKPERLENSQCFDKSTPVANFLLLQRMRERLVREQKRKERVDFWLGLFQPWKRLYLPQHEHYRQLTYFVFYTLFALYLINVLLDKLINLYGSH